MLEVFDLIRSLAKLFDTWSIMMNTWFQHVIFTRSQYTVPEISGTVNINEHVVSTLGDSPLPLLLPLPRPQRLRDSSRSSLRFHCFGLENQRPFCHLLLRFEHVVFHRFKHVVSLKTEHVVSFILILGLPAPDDPESGSNGTGSETTGKLDNGAGP